MLFRSKARALLEEAKGIAEAHDAYRTAVLASYDKQIAESQERSLLLKEELVKCQARQAELKEKLKEKKPLTLGNIRRLRREREEAAKLVGKKGGDVSDDIVVELESECDLMDGLIGGVRKLGDELDSLVARLEAL